MSRVATLTWSRAKWNLPGSVPPALRLMTLLGTLLRNAANLPLHAPSLAIGNQPLLRSSRPLLPSIMDKMLRWPPPTPTTSSPVLQFARHQMGRTSPSYPVQTQDSNCRADEGTMDTPPTPYVFHFFTVAPLLPSRGGVPTQNHCLGPFFLLASLPTEDQASAPPISGLFQPTGTQKRRLRTRSLLGIQMSWDPCRITLASNSLPVQVFDPHGPVGFIFPVLDAGLPFPGFL